MKHCSKCDKDFHKDDLFCDECGSKLELKAKHKDKKENKKKSEHHIQIKFSPKKIIKWGIILIIILVIGFLLGYGLMGGFNEISLFKTKIQGECLPSGGLCSLEKCPSGYSKNSHYTCKEEILVCCFGESVE